MENQNQSRSEKMKESWAKRKLEMTSQPRPQAVVAGVSLPPTKESPKEQPETAPQPLSPQAPEQPSQEPKSSKTEESPKSDDKLIAEKLNNGFTVSETKYSQDVPVCEPIQIDVSTMVVLLQAEVARLKRAVELLYWTRPANVTTPKSQEMVSELDKMYKFQTK